MLLLFSLSVFSKMIIKVEPSKPFIIDFPLEEEHSDLNISLSNLNPKEEVRYKIVKDSYNTDFEVDTLSTLESVFNKKYVDQGLYTLILYNMGSEDCLVSLHSSTNKVMGNEDKDVKALKTLFSEIEARLSRLYDLYLRLKTIQEKNIAEARRIIRGLFVMFIIPFVYILVGFAKMNAVKTMFAPKKGMKV